MYSQTSVHEPSEGTHERGLFWQMIFENRFVYKNVFSQQYSGSLTLMSSP